MFEDLNYAVVAGLDLNGLGVVRALAGNRVPVIALDADLKKPTAATRYGIKLRVGALSGEEFIKGLLQLRERLSRDPVLILTQEASVGTVSALRSRIDQAYRFTLPPDSVMQDLLDKLRFQAIAQQRGFAVPRAVRLERGREPVGIGEMRYPCVFKPATKAPEYGRRFAKAYRVASPKQVLELWSKVQDAVDRVIVQEWIEGDDSDVYFCLQYRRPNGVVASFAGRKIYQWPPLVGGTASCVPAPEFSDELTSLTDSFLSAVGFTGMGSMEYKRDRRDGRFYMIEPTVGRTDLQEEIAALNGVNIPLAAYRSELGLAVPPTRTVDPPRLWRDPNGVALARQAGVRSPRLPRRHRVSDAFFRVTDPAPFVALKIRAACSRLSRIARVATAWRRLRAAEERA